MAKHVKLSQKLFYKIGEVCSLTELEPYTLRYWEKEFPSLSPRKNSAGQRIYTPEDVKLVDRIKHLLYRQGYTIEGARKQIERERTHLSIAPPSPEAFDALKEENQKLKETLRKLRKEFRSLMKELKRRPVK